MKVKELKYLYKKRLKSILQDEIKSEYQQTLI